MPAGVVCPAEFDMLYIVCVCMYVRMYLCIHVYVCVAPCVSLYVLKMRDSVTLS